MKRPNQSIFFGFEGQTVGIHPDEIYDDNHRYVKAHPELFEEVAVITDKGSKSDVEQATKAPGEKRTTRRP